MLAEAVEPDADEIDLLVEEAELWAAADLAAGSWRPDHLLSRDPIGEAGGANLYGYVGNGPTDRRDPSGLCSEALAGAAVLAVWDRRHDNADWGPGTDDPSPDSYYHCMAFCEATKATGNTPCGVAAMVAMAGAVEAHDLAGGAVMYVPLFVPDPSRVEDSSEDMCANATGIEAALDNAECHARCSRHAPPGYLRHLAATGGPW